MDNVLYVPATAPGPPTRPTSCDVFYRGRRIIWHGHVAPSTVSTRTYKPGLYIIQHDTLGSRLIPEQGQ